jgi:hypothetical protein
MDEERMHYKRHWRHFGWSAPAGLFIGMGIGWILGYLVQGLLIGLGVGIMVAGIARSRTKVD